MGMTVTSAILGVFDLHDILIRLHLFVFAKMNLFDLDLIMYFRVVNLLPQ